VDISYLAPPNLSHRVGILTPVNKGFQKQNDSERTAADRMFAGANHLLFKKAAELRKHPTYAEEVLWGYLRTKPFGFKFRKQHPYLNYILDFYCHQRTLVIEADGSIHEKEDVKENDAVRQNHLAHHGLTVLRFTNNEIRNKPEDVIAQIEHHLRISSV
jgi:very-short-patch-repair endonuclease